MPSRLLLGDNECEIGFVQFIVGVMTVEDDTHAIAYNLPTNICRWGYAIKAKVNYHLPSMVGLVIV